MMFCDAKNPSPKKQLRRYSLCRDLSHDPIAEGAIDTSCSVNLIVMQPQLCGSCGSIDV
jgi:hypothetical protein